MPNIVNAIAPSPGPFLRGTEFVAGMPPGYLVIFAQDESDWLAIRQNLHSAAVSLYPGYDWRPEFANHLANFDLLIFTRRNAGARAVANRVAGDCYSKAARVRVMDIFGLDGNEGIPQWISRGGDRPRLLHLIAQTQDWLPSSGGASTSVNNVPVAQSISARVFASVDEIEAVVALNRILDAVDCPGRCRAYPSAVMSALYESFTTGASLDQFQSFSARVGAYLPGPKSSAGAIRKTLQRRALRAEAAFTQWQHDSGYVLVTRTQVSNTRTADPYSLYRIPLLQAWCEALTIARTSPGWRRGRQKRARAIRKAAAQVARHLRVSVPENKSASTAGPRHHSAESKAPAQIAYLAVTTGLRNAFQAISAEPLKELSRRADPALADSLVSEIRDLTEVTLTALWTEFNRTASVCIPNNQQNTSGRSEVQALWLQLLRPYLRRQIVAS